MRIFLRWSARDLRLRWVQVAAIAFIIGLGSGTYSGLSSTSAWRRISYDASFRSLRHHDLHVTLSTGSYVGADALRAAAESIPHARQLDAVEPRLVSPTQVDASTAGRTILVPGQIVSVDVTRDRPAVDLLSTERGRALGPADATLPRAVLDYHFAQRRNLPPSGVITVSGGTKLRYVGQALAPDYFLITGAEGGLLAESSYAVVFVPLAEAQAIAGRPGQANDLVLTVRPGADIGVVRRELRAALTEQFPGVGFDVTRGTAEHVYRAMYDDIANDQRFYDIFALLILAGAAFAAFNLTARMVEAQRREIGIGMALGSPPRRLAVRPLLVGAEIAVLGVVFGVGVGIVISALMGSVLRGFVPLPDWQFPFQTGTFLRGAALGLALPIVATLYPVWRAVTMTPVDAIRTGVVRSRRRAMRRRIALPGRTTAQLPFRNLVRAPRRTLVTALGVAAAITVLVGVVGMIDSFFETIDRADAEILKTNPRRLSVDLQSFVPASDPSVAGLEQNPVVAGSETHLRVGGTLVDGARIDVLIQVLDLDHGLWTPTIDDRHPPGGRPGIVISEKAARDLGVSAGDTVVLRHPKRTGVTSYDYERTRVRVLGYTPLPTRFVTFMDTKDASIMGLDGITNTVVVAPRAGVSTAAAERALFSQPGVASVQPVADLTDSVRSELSRVLDILLIVEGAVLLLALLIAFNTASINGDERARDHATMFAFGLPVRTVMRMAVTESAVVGALGTALGILCGWVLLGWLVSSLIPQAYPDLWIVSYLAPATLLTAVVVGVGAVAAAPLFTLRRLRRMDIPSTLRVTN